MKARRLGPGHTFRSNLLYAIPDLPPPHEGRLLFSRRLERVRKVAVANHTVRQKISRANPDWSLEARTTNGWGAQDLLFRYRHPYRGIYASVWVMGIEDPEDIPVYSGWSIGEPNQLIGWRPITGSRMYTYGCYRYSLQQIIFYGLGGIFETSIRNTAEWCRKQNNGKADSSGPHSVDVLIDRDLNGTTTPNEYVWLMENWYNKENQEFRQNLTQGLANSRPLPSWPWWDESGNPLEKTVAGPRRQITKKGALTLF